MSDGKKVVQEKAHDRQTEVQKVSKKRLIDSLNSVNFRENPIMVNLEHTRYGNPLFLRAYPQPCSGELLHCVWAEPCPANLATGYTARNFMVDRGLDLLIVDGRPIAALRLADVQTGPVKQLHRRFLQAPGGQT